MRWIAFWNRSSGRLLAALSAGAVLMGAMLCSCSMNELTRVSTHDFPEPQSCAHCHVDIYNEWNSSPHARAFTNPRFVAATDDHRFNQCLGCHAPQPTMVTTEPKPRATQCELGVTCVSCHLSRGAMVGPLAPTGMVRPHPITVDAAPFESGRLCGQCHQGTLAQWKAATHETGGDCRQCHMPSIVRKTTQATGEISKIFVAAEKNVPEHRHLFTLTPDDLSEPGMTLDLQPTASCATLTLSNHLPHNLPTGDFGVRLIEISADGIDAKGNVTPLAHWELTNAGGGSLGAGQSREWSVALPTSVRKLRSTVIRQGRDGADRVVLLTREAAVP